MDNPDYMGFWSQEDGRNQYFFLKFTSGTLTGDVSGTIEDELGSAFFRGTRNEKLLKFTKQYQRAHAQACTELVYEGNETSPGFFEGTWESTGRVVSNGKFYMEPYHVSATLEVIVANLTARNSSLPMRPVRQ